MKKLYRSTENRMIAVICGGLEESLNVDATIVRLVVVFATIVTGFVPGFLTYVIGWAIIPERTRGGGE